MVRYTQYSECPTGWAVAGQGVYIIDGQRRSGTACDTICLSPVYSESQYDQLDIISLTSVILGLVLIDFLIFSLAGYFDFKKNYAIGSMIFACVCITILLLCLRLYPREARFCAGVGRGLDASDGVTFCAITGMGGYYLTLMLAVAWLVQCYHISLFTAKAKWKQIMDQSKMKLNMAIMVVIPLIPTMYMIVEGLYGYNSETNPSICFLSRDHSDMATYLYYIPIALIALLGTIMLASFFYKYFQVLNETRQSNGETRNNYIYENLKKVRFVCPYDKD
jgi:hypothetical protein